MGSTARKPKLPKHERALCLVTLKKEFRNKHAREFKRKLFHRNSDVVRV
jgi:hypothetical protein